MLEEPEEIALYKARSKQPKHSNKASPLSLSLSLCFRPSTAQTACNQAPALRRLMVHGRGSEKASAVSDFRDRNLEPSASRLHYFVPISQAEAKVP